jgi:hypothetical protein
MRRLGSTADLATWIDELEIHDALTKHRLVFAAARTLIGDVHGAQPLEVAASVLNTSLKHRDRLELIRRLAFVYAHARTPAATRDMFALTGQFRIMADTFGTNTHFCLSVVWFVDALVYGLLGLDFSRPGWAPQE